MKIVRVLARRRCLSGWGRERLDGRRHERSIDNSRVMRRLRICSLISLLAHFFFFDICACETASFYGASFISIPIQDASSTTDIYLRFRTHRREGLLFLAAGPTDYCALSLEDGEVRLRLNLGSGEVSLASAAGLRLDDLVWHEVEVHRSETELSLTLDGIHSTYLDIPGRFSELNIKSGLFVGGLSPAFNELYLGHIDNFRGCIGDVTFNDQEILKMAAENSDPRSVFGITWECSSEFEASSLQPISFVERGSFVALPSWNARNGAIMSFDLKTQSPSAVLFYSAGSPSQSDFAALEIVNGKLVLSVNEGNGLAALQADVIVSDGNWHHIQIQFGPSYLEMTSDGQIKNLRQGGGPGENRFFDLAGYLYLGGVELNRQTRALQDGLQSVGSELRGCIRNLKINGQMAGLREAEVTQGVRADCVWQYPCLQKPCHEGGECFQEGLDSFRCLCDSSDHQSCVRSNFSGSGYKLYASSLPVDLEVLALQPLQVAEGSGALLTLEHIRVTVDFVHYGVRDSGVIFHVIDSPRHGTLEVELWRSEGERVFTLLDLATEKVRYTHDGSETDGDSMTLELEFRARNFRLPAFLEQRHRLTFHIRISPVNDPPQIKPIKVLRVAKGGKQTISDEFLQAEDPDTSPERLTYTVVSLEEGFLENVKRPGEPLESFTQDEVNNKLIAYVHRGSALTARLTLRLSDGSDESMAVIAISSFDLTLSPSRNTGLLLPRMTHATITPENLTFVVSNSDQLHQEVRYEVTSPPKHGILQKLRPPDATWQPSNHFTQRQIVRGKVRYLHTGSDDVEDSFHFVVSCGQARLPKPHDFRLAIASVTLEREGAKELSLEREVEAMPLTQLRYRTVPLDTPPEQIIYTLDAKPIHGYLLLHNAERLDIGSSWTQLDLDRGNLQYRLQQRHSAGDQILFAVKASDQETTNQKMTISHSPFEKLTNEKLVVVEGERGVIGRGQLYVEVPESVLIVFNITEPPKYGQLLLDDEGPCAAFTSEQLEKGALTYAHDGSEHEQDLFTFVATSPLKEDIFHHGVFRISIILKNDNPPVRAIDKAFYVVQGGEKKLTGRDIRYQDEDIDSKPSDIQYTRRGIPNGALFHIDNSQIQVFQFTQEDLDQEKIIFRHTGADHGQAVLWVTDGQFYATGVLEIRAAPPFLNITRNTGLVVRKGGNNFITSANLSVETNLDTDEVRFKIVSRPRRGDLLLNGHSANQFSASQLGPTLTYQSYDNEEQLVTVDSFTFVVFVGDTTTEENNFEIRIFPDEYWNPLKLTSNRIVKVDQSQRVTIDNSVIEVVGSGKISYEVREWPQHGLLRLDNDPNVTTFSQLDIDDRHLTYQQVDREAVKDNIVLDASNGVSTISGLLITIEVVSKLIHLRTGNVTVYEGQSISLSEAVSVPQSWDGHILIVEKPKYGTLLSSDGREVTIFTPTQLERGEILYRHDDSETTRDWFTLVARGEGTRRRESAPGTVHVAVLSVNDEAPHLVNNTGLEMWEGSVATIAGGMLAAADDDSEAGELTFVISSSNNGYVAFRNDTTTPILSFTQENLNDGEVVYLHTGERTGGFRFQVNDGINYGSPHVFTVMARPLKILIATNHKLYIFPRMQQSITKDHLLVLTNDPKNERRQVVFHLTRPPSYGRILLESPDGALNPVTQFTQEQINNNLVLYEALSDVAAVDTVTFDLETPHAEIVRNIEFHVVISVGNVEGEGSLRDIIHLRSLEVEEGAVVAVGPKHINISRLLELWQEKGKRDFADRLRIRVPRLPSHGWLELEERNLSATSWFGHKEVRLRLLRYHHDGSDTQTDTFTLALYLAADDRQPEVLFFNGSLPVVIFPVNDQHFVLRTPTPHLEVIQSGQGSISSDILNTTDDDGIPGDILYELVSTPTGGFVIKQTSPVTTFTQEDVDEGRIFFQHDASQNSSSGGFHFKVSDGQHKATYAVFTVHFLPRTLTIAKVKDEIQLAQGTAATFLQPRHLGVLTNGDRDKLHYNLTKAPSYGQLRVQDQPAESFSEHHLASEAVVYVQLNFSASEDAFQVSVCDELSRKEIDTEVKMRVVPLVRQKICNMTLGGDLVLTVEHLDASPLAARTKSNPLFQVLRPPRLASVLVLSSRTRRSHQVRFSHEDVLAGFVVLRSRPSHNLTRPLDDLFEYEVTAPHVQPARGHFAFIVFPLQMEEESRDPVLNTTSSDPATPEVFHPSISSDDFLLVGIGCATVLVLALTLILAIKCRAARRKRQDGETPNQGKFPGSGTAQTDLADRLPSNTSLSDELPPPVPPTSPSSIGSEPPTLPPPYISSACKVTPLEPGGFFGDTSEEWNHLDDNEPLRLGPPLNPLLGKNQYWV